MLATAIALVHCGFKSVNTQDDKNSVCNDVCNKRKTQGSKLQLLQSPMQLTFSPW